MNKEVGPLQSEPSALEGSAFVQHDLDSPMAGAMSGPLAPLTFAVKDLYSIAGHRCSGGSPDWLAAATPAAATAPVVAALLGAGASLIGKTICDEFFYSLTGANAHFGTPINPRWPGRLPGGSSSGSASAVAAGTCDFALGSDTGGSVRIPAAFCGVWGIRPTHGRLDASGVMAMAPSFDTVGWFAPSPGVLAKVGEVLLDDDSPTPTVDRIVVPTDVVGLVDDEVAEAFRRFGDRIAAKLPTAEPVDVYGGAPDQWAECFRVIQGAEVAETYGPWIREHTPRLGPGIAERMAYALSVSAADAAEARRHREAIADHLHTVMSPGTVMLMPTAPCEPPPVAAAGAQLQRFRAAAMRLTCIAGLGGLPQVAFPIPSRRGPLSASLVGPPGSDRLLLRMAVQLSRWTAR